MIGRLGRRLLFISGVVVELTCIHLEGEYDAFSKVLNLLSGRFDRPMIACLVESVERLN